MYEAVLWHFRGDVRLSWCTLDPLLSSHKHICWCSCRPNSWEICWQLKPQQGKCFSQDKFVLGEVLVLKSEMDLGLFTVILP